MTNPSQSTEHLHSVAARVTASLEEADRLLDDDHASAAFVWAVRSMEIFTKEFLLAPLYLDKTHDNWPKAVKQAAKLFGSSNWDAAYAKIEEFCGPLDQMLTEGGTDAWTYWQKTIVRHRGDVVHGRLDGEADAEDAATAIAYAKQLRTQLTLRMIISRKHPFSDVFLSIIEQAKQEYEGRQVTTEADRFEDSV